LLVKGLYENTLGRVSELIGGWDSADDRHATKVQKAYGAFMHETPWYEFPFTKAFNGLWNTTEPDHKLRHWERRFALSGEYGVKAGYAALLGWASGASLGRDERTLRFVTSASPAMVRNVDVRLRPVGRTASGTVVEAPRYAQFTDLLTKLSHGNAKLTEISGNDDVFLTALVRTKAKQLAGANQLMALPLADRPGWQRVGLSTKVPELLPLLRAIRSSGGSVEHVYDY
jgi:hypothetical protein